jgi:hypothetical protein
MGYEADAACVVFIFRVVKALGRDHGAERNLKRKGCNYSAAPTNSSIRNRPESQSRPDY